MSESIEMTSRSDSYRVTVDAPAAGAVVATGDRKSAAVSAFKNGDAAASRAAHDIPAEQHNTESGVYVKSLVFGGLDGIITTFAVVASASGANLSTEVVLVMGFANLLADGVSMGFGEYLSGDAEAQYIKKEIKREQWEMDNHPEGEVKEMIDIYVEKGFTVEDATSIITTMAKNNKFFVEHMCVQELGLMPPDDDDSAFKQGLVMFCSFVCFGILPLLSYLCFSTIGSLNEDELFGISVGLTSAALFGLGAWSARFSASPWYNRGLWVFANGATAAGVAYFVGWAVTQIVDVDCV